MARAKKNQKKEISRVELNGLIIVKYDDGSMDIISTTQLTPDEAEKLFGTIESEEEDEEEDEEDEEDEDVEEEEDDEDEDDEDSDDEEDSDDDDEDDDDEEEEEEEEEEEDELTPEELLNMDFEEMEDLCDEKGLDTDPDDFEEDEDKLRKAIAKELGIALPKSKKNTKKSKK